MKKPNSRATFINIPNDEYGREFLRMLRLHINTSEATMKSQGRGGILPPNQHGWDDLSYLSIPLHIALTVDVYIKTKVEPL